VTNNNSNLVGVGRDEGYNLSNVDEHIVRSLGGGRRGFQGITNNGDIIKKC
jgi:hypothetical protein